VRRDLPRPLDDLPRRVDQRRRAGDRRARAERALAVIDLIGVAIGDPDALEGNAKPLVNDLREDRLVALPVRVRADEHEDAAGAVEADLGALLHRLVVRAGGDLDDVGEADAAQLSARLCGGAARRIPRPVRQLQRGVHVLLELAAVIGVDEPGLVRHRLGRDEVAPAQRDPVDAGLARGNVDDPLDGVGRLGPAGAAVGRGGVAVGEDPGDGRMDVRRPVGAGEAAEIVGRDVDAAHREMGAEIGDRGDAEREEDAVLVERQLHRRDVVAGMEIRDEGLAAIGLPAHRATDFPRRPQCQRPFGVAAALHCRTRRPCRARSRATDPAAS